MINNKMIINDEYNLNDINSRNHLFYNLIYGDFIKIQDEISKSKILIIGCGGIGNFIGTMLTGIGVKEIILVDGDEIEPHNLNRQFIFSTKDILKKKALILKKELKKRNPNIKITSIPKMADMNLLNKIKTKIDMIIFCADSRELVKIINEYSVKNKIAMLNVGYINDISVIGPIYIPEKTPCLVCNDINCFENKIEIKDDLKQKIYEINSLYKSPSSFSNNSLAAAMASIEIISCLTKQYDKLNSLNKRIGISNLDFKCFEINVLRNKDCLVCGAKNG